MRFVMSLEIDDFLELVAKAKDERDRQEAWDMWVARYPLMTKDTFEPFEDFYRKLQKPKRLSNRPAEEILAEASEIQSRIRGT